MTVGNQMTSSTVDGLISQCAVNLRNVMQAITNLSLNVNGQGAGLAYLESIGYDSTDAAAALAAISYLNTMAGVYEGTATQATTFDFNQELSQYWGGI